MQDIVEELIELLDLSQAVILLVVLLIVIWILGRILKFLIIRLTVIHPDARNGILLVLKLGQLFVVAFSASLLFNVDLNFLIGSSTIIATAIGFASTSVAANIVGGLYIIVTRPFGVGDIVEIDSTSGLVLEIGLNYTRVLALNGTIVTIPNSNLINAKLLNSNINVGKEMKRRKKEERVKESRVHQRSISLTIPDVFIDSFETKEIVRYSHTVQLKLNQYSPPLSIVEVKKRMDKVCEQFSPVFGFKPRYYFGKHVFRQDTHLVITATDANKLFKNYGNFMSAIMEEVFQEIQ